jgi:uncharacterized membrane protein
MINLKSELEIRILHKKVHHLIKYQQEEIQFKRYKVIEHYFLAGR